LRPSRSLEGYDRGITKGKNYDLIKHKGGEKGLKILREKAAGPVKARNESPEVANPGPQSGIYSMNLLRGVSQEVVRVWKHKEGPLT